MESRPTAIQGMLKRFSRAKILGACPAFAMPKSTREPANMLLLAADQADVSTTRISRRLARTFLSISGGISEALAFDLFPLLVGFNSMSRQN